MESALEQPPPDESTGASSPSRGPTVSSLLILPILSTLFLLSLPARSQSSVSGALHNDRDKRNDDDGAVDVRDLACRLLDNVLALGSIYEASGERPDRDECGPTSLRD